MIILNDRSDNKPESMAERMAKNALYTNNIKLNKIVGEMERQIERESYSGNNTYTMVLHEKSSFITDGLISKIKQYIIDNGFGLDYNYVSEKVEGDSINFHKFIITWG